MEALILIYAVIGMVPKVLNMFMLINIYLNIILLMEYFTQEMTVEFINQKIMEMYGQI